jgi:hypothetical protein
MQARILAFDQIASHDDDQRDMALAGASPP